MQKAQYSVVFKEKIKKFNKKIKIPPCKSTSIRAFLIGSISQGISEVKNILESNDVLQLKECLKKLEVVIKKIKPQHYKIYGKGLGSLYCKKNTILDAQNSGTTLRLIASLISTTPNLQVKLKGDKSLNHRNMSELIKLLSQFGASFYPKKKYLPLTLVSSNMPTSISYKASSSAQLKSAAILAGLQSFGNTTIVESKNSESRDVTENMLLNSKSIKIKRSKKGNVITVFGRKNFSGINFTTPNDPSSASIIMTLALLTNSKLKLPGIGINPKRLGFCELIKNNAKNRIQILNRKKNKINELVGTILVKGTKKIKPIKSSKKFYPRLVDEYVVSFLVSAFSKGTSVYNFHEKDLLSLRNKESDRVKEMCNLLKKIKIKTKVTKNSVKIYGNPNIKPQKKIINVYPKGDHRIAMSGSILGLLGFKIRIHEFLTVSSSFPNFLSTIKKLGGKFEIKKN